MAHINIGTSGWHYGHWVGPFYPHGLTSDHFLHYYAKSFNAVEINNTFYRLPKPEVIKRWREQAPQGFIFSCKASRYITHMKKLREPGGSTKRFLDTIGQLGAKLGPILFQLPPHWRMDLKRLTEFLDVLPKRYRYTFEFRDKSWLDKRTYEVLARHNVACCFYDLNGDQSPFEITANFVYVRLHGPADRYQGSYCDKTLEGWAQRILTWRSDGREVYCFFDNDEKGYAPKNARQLGNLIRQIGDRGATLT